MIRSAGPSVVLVVLLGLIGSGEAIAQVSKHQAGVSLGWQRDALWDEQASPLRYAGAAWTAGGFYAFRGDRHRHVILVDYGRLGLRSSITDSEVHRESGWQIALRHVYGRRIVRGLPDRWHLHLGAAALVRFALREHQYLPSTSETFFAGHALVGPALAVGREFEGGGELVARTALGIIGVTGRPGYSIKGLPLVRFARLPATGAVSQYLGLQRRLFTWFGMRLGYTWTYDWMNTPFHLRVVRHALHAGAVLIW